MKLNKQQSAVNKWVREGSGSLNLIARAGCGKTFTLIRGVVRTIVEEERGSISLMAFNKSAALEFGDRLKALAEETEDKRFTAFKYVNSGTVHSFGYSAVRYWTSNRVKVDGDKCAKLLRSFSEADFDVYSVDFGPILRLVSLAKQSALPFFTRIDDYGYWEDLAEYHGVDDQIEYPLDQVITASQEILKKSISLDREIVDFDDMILAPLVHNLRVWPTDWVLIDEAQDTNSARRALAFKILKPKTGRLVAVGDDRQAIYGFTGANHNSLDIIRRELGSSVLPLTITYRCPKAVVKEANRLVPDLVAHKTAPEGIVRSLQRTVPRPSENGEIVSDPWFTEERPTAADAVLCRNTRPLIEEAYRMLAAGLGCRIEGRDIGAGLVKLVTRWKRVETLGALADKLEEYRDREIQKWKAKGREDRAQGVEDQVEALQVMIGALLGKNPGAGLQDLVGWIEGMFGDTRPGEIPKVVTLSTIHKAKGREWDRVYLLSRQETLPSPWARKDWQMRQEENLEYVALTRAKKELVYVD